MLTKSFIYRVDFLERENPLYVCAPSFHDALSLVDQFIEKSGKDYSLYSIELLKPCII